MRAVSVHIGRKVHVVSSVTKVSWEILPKWNFTAQLPGLNFFFTFSKCLPLKWKLRDMQYAYNITWGVFVQPLLPRRINKHYLFSLCFCSLRYPVCNSHALYCHLWPARLYNIFPHYLINSTIFGNKLLNIKVCFDFCYQFCLKRFSL